MRFGIVGARLAGSYAALLLAQQGHEVLLFDDRPEKEKPCGGGITAKALAKIAWFRENPLPHTQVELLRLTTQDGRASNLPLRHPIRIYSRFTLDSALRDTAVRAGARFFPERALRFVRVDRGWVIRTPKNEYEVDFLVGADGATSAVRRTTTGSFAAADLSLALGFYLPGLHHPDTILTVFQESGYLGYLWSFPRVDHASIGILRWLPHADAAGMRRRVLDFISAHYPGSNGDMRFYAARIPCLSRRSLARQRVCGQDWALLGDAAGFVDPITAEGIYYALRSAELLADSVRRGEPLRYAPAWWQDFGAELNRAAGWRDRFYGGTFLCQAFIRRALQAVRSSPTIRSLTDELISGIRSYEELKRRIILWSPRILLETLSSTVARSAESRP